MESFQLSPKCKGLHCQKDLTDMEWYYPFTEKERAAFNKVFGLDDELDGGTDEELKIADAAGEKFKSDAWEEPNEKGFKMDKNSVEKKEEKPKEEKSQVDHARTKEEINLIKYIEYMGSRIASLEHNKRVIAYIDSKKGDVSEEVLAKVHSLVPAIMTNKDFKKDGWKTREGQKLKISKTGYIRKSQAEKIKNAWNALPESNIHGPSEFILCSTTDVAWTPGFYRPGKNDITIRLNAIVELSQDFCHSLIVHESGHWKWHNVITDEQKDEWEKRIMENPKLRYTTSYTTKHFNKYEEIADELGENHNVTKIFKDLAFNELHSEVSAWSKYPGGEKDTTTMIDHDFLKEATKIYKEIFE